MANKVAIGVEAQIDTNSVSQKINELGQKIAQANKVQYNPVSAKTAEELSKIVKQFEQLRRVQGDLNKRMKSTGQAGAGLLDVDWDKLYPDQHSRARQMRKAFEYSVGNQFGGGGTSPSPGQPNRPPAGPSMPGMAAGVAQAGLRAAGPAGGVAAGAMGTGMSAGFGAGLMGLMGGMLALGVGKIVGGVMEKLGQAQANDVALDKLKRTLGDVNVAFDALKLVVSNSATGLKVTYEDAGKLATQFVKLGNVSSGKYTSLGGELGVGVGMSRAFGMDPSEGVGVMGQMRGIGATSNTQESRRFALLIGETIGKSNAFAKSEEVMESLAGFAVSQARNNMGRANVSGYAGMYSAMVGSGIPGLDPSGAGSMLGRVNASLSAGGAKGEASQFFTAMVGNRMGLDSLQTQVMREGGAFATNDSMFGKDSAYKRYMGHKGPTGGSNFLAETRSLLEQQYGGDSDDRKLLRAQAFGNHTGLSMNQSMAMLSLKPNQMGGMEKYGDLKNFNAAGIGNLSKVLHGSDADRQGVYDGLMRRKDISADEKSALKRDMGNAGGDVEQQKSILATLVATKDQEATDGKTIRDQKAQVDNIATKLAGELIPAVNAMKAGIIFMAGKGSMSERDIMKEVAKLDSRDKQDTIKANSHQNVLDALGEQDAVAGKHKDALANLKKNKANMSPQELEAAQADVARLWREKALKEEEVRLRILKLQEEKEKLLEDEVKNLGDTIKKISAPIIAPVDGAEPAPSSGGNVGSAPSGGKAKGDGSSLPAGMGALGSDPEHLAKLAANEREIGAPPGLLRAQQEQESRFHTKAVSPTGAKGLAQVTSQTLRAIEKRVGRKLDPFDKDDANLIQKEVMKENYAHFGNWDDATSAYNGGWDKGKWGNSETANYTPSVKRRMARYQRPGTELPPGTRGGPGGSQSGHITADDITVHVVGADRKPIAPSQTIQTRVRAASPYGNLSGVNGPW